MTNLPASASRSIDLVAYEQAAESRPTDAVLLQACRAGDAQAWDELVGRYDRLVFSVALRNGLSRDDAADVCQLTFVCLLESIDRIEDDSRLASWLMTVARRQAWRTTHRNRRESPAAELPERAEDPFERWHDIAAVHSALQQLPDRGRALIDALYFDPSHPSYAEIAARLDLSVGGIGPLRGRCLARLRALMVEAAE
jgi:RNA polymerase sigma factor (sigma-70 family)